MPNEKPRAIRLIPHPTIKIIREYGTAQLPYEQMQAVTGVIPRVSLNGRRVCRCCGFNVTPGEPVYEFTWWGWNEEHPTDVYIHRDPCTWGASHEEIT